MDTDDLIVDFNAVLTSGGGSLSERQFLSDYRGLIGKAIPFRELGHSNLKSLLQSLGGFYFTTRGGETYIHAQVDERTAHITSLIARQKKKPGDRKSKGRRPTSYNRQTSYNRPKVVPRLNRLEIRPAPIQRTPLLVAPVQRAPPPPRYGNPPIIPQRQPLPLMQKQLELSKEGTNAQSRLERAAPIINKKEAETRILSDNSVVNGTAPAVNNKGYTVPQESPGESSFIDFQWLQGRIHRPSDKPLPGVPNSVTSVGGPPPLLATPVRKPLLATPVPKPLSATPVPKPPLATPVPKPVSARAPKQTPSSATKQAPASPSEPAPNSSSKQLKSCSRLLDQKVVFKSHVEELSNLAADLDLGDPIFKYMERRPSGGKPVYVAKVKLHSDIMFSSYPEERSTPEEAQELVSKLACEDLRKRLSRREVSESVNATELEKRIYEIVKSKPNGMFDQAVTSAYEENFKTSLPVSWLETIQDSPKFSVERYNENKAIIYPLDEDSLKKQVPDVPVKATDVASVPVEATSPSPEALVYSNGVDPVASVAVASPGTVLCKDINSNTVPVGAPRKLPGLQLPTEPMWDVYVASIDGPDIWVRLIGKEYDTRYNDVITNLELNSLSASDQAVTNPQIEELYYAKLDNCLLRVQLKEISDEECTVFLVDIGEEDTIPVSELKVLDDEYLQLPAQAIQCRLCYVDITYEAAQIYLMSHVLGSTFVAEVLQYPAEENIASIVLHNTEVDGTAINVNYCILEETVKTLEKPIMPQRHIAFLRVTHACQNTPPFVQLEGKDLEFLQSILEEIFDKLDLVLIHGLNAHPNLMKVLKDKQYLVKSSKDPQSWRRGTIVNIEDTRNPRVFFIDYGYHENVALSDIFDIDKVMPALKKFPPQAIQVNLARLPPSELDEAVVCRLQELAPPDESIFGRLTEDGQYPVVELLKRMQPNNVILNINTDLQFHREEYVKKTLQPKIIDETTSPRRGSLESTSLKMYPTPQETSYFDVLVSMTSNPSNFVVQPVKELNSAFNLMMKELQEKYRAQETVMPVPSLEDLQENAAFAARHPDDNQWYRVSIVAVLSDSRVGVKYSDYGDAGLVEIGQLRYLDSKFRQMPALAIRAKLHGVKPKNMDWSVDECVQFNKLIENKPFVSKVCAVNNEGNCNSWQVSLQLIDTTNPDLDVDIAKALIEANLADKCD